MKTKILAFFISILSLTTVFGQEEDPFISFDIPAQNLLKFNRFLINPTFSTVREDNSYINLYHRNQWIQFEDSPEVYLASYSGRIGDRTGLGLGLYQQNLGVITNFGILANYAYGIRLAPKSSLTFGFNLSFFTSGLDNGELFPGMPDPALESIEDNSLLSFQPGINLSVGSFDFGVYAENLVDFNLRTSESVTEFDEKTFSGHIQYTKKFENASGILQNGRFSALTRARKQGNRDLNLSGSLIVDLPKVGWLQGGYDDFFGVSAGLGFNLTKRLSLGYTIEKGLSDGIQNLGTTHEITFAYSFQPNLTEDRVELDDLFEEENKDRLAQLEEEIEGKDEAIDEKDDEISRLKKNLEENNMILAELILKQDSLEKAVNKDIEKRFYNLIKSMKRTPANNNTAVASNDRPAPVYRKNTNSKNNSNQGGVRVINTVSRGNNNSIGFIEAAKANNIKQRTYANLDGVDGGYYIIANVYSNKKNGNLYKNKFVQKLKRDGINDANYFLNTKNNLNYVYLKRYDNWQDAIAAYKSNVDNTYTGEIWILNVENEDNLRYADNNPVKRSSTSRNTSEKNRISSPTNKPSSIASTKGRVVSTPNTAKKENKDRVNTPTVANIQKKDGNTSKQNNKNTNTRVNTPVKNNVVRKSDQNAVADLDNKTEDEIKELYSKSTSKRRKTAKKGRIINIASLDEGYYIITNVFAVPSNAVRFVKKLKDKGLDADYFVNPENNYRYVYIKKHDSWNNALASYYSNVNNSYFDDMWIMRVNTNYTL